MMPGQIPEVPAVQPIEVGDLLNDGALLIDVREQNEWDEARIPGAVLKPMSQINDWYQDLPREQTIVFSCRSGQRSAQVVNALITQAGFDNVVNLVGGIIGWAHADLAVETGLPS